METSKEKVSDLFFDRAIRIIHCYPLVLSLFTLLIIINPLIKDGRSLV